MKSKLGQMEMIGLVIIVILITLGMLFMAIFALQQDPQKKIFTRKGLAYSTLGAAMKTNVLCENSAQGDRNPQLGKEIIDDCAAHYNDKEYCLYNCGGLDCCSFMNQTMERMLNSTLGSWGKRYEFKSQLIQGKGLTPIVLSEIKGKGGCAGRERDSSGLFPLQAGDAGIVENVLYLCD